MSLDTHVTTIIDRAHRHGVASAMACRVERDGETICAVDRGVLQRVGRGGEIVPISQQEPVTDRTRFDVASLTKVYSALTLLQLVETKTLTLDEPVANVLEEFGAWASRRRVTLRHLLTHTSGLPPTWDGWRAPLRAWLLEHPSDTPLGPCPLAAEPLWHSLIDTPLVREPGEAFEYSCVGFLVAQRVAEHATGRAWGDLVREIVLKPADLTGTGFGAAPGDAAATEWQPEIGRGMVRGFVHDETAWALGGTCANAGLFATADDVVRLSTWLRDAASPTLRRRMLSAQPSNRIPENIRTSLGLRLGEPWMAVGTHAGHTGFTGTSIEIAPERNATIVLLTNRVHPSRETAGITDLRRALSNAMCEELPLTEG